MYMVFVWEQASFVGPTQVFTIIVGTGDEDDKWSIENPDALNAPPAHTALKLLVLMP